VAFARLTGRSDQHVRERERARAAAEEIVEPTGLDVDSTIGSSPTVGRVDPAGGELARSERSLSRGMGREGAWS
jgi:hypothetical protein